MNEQFEQLKKRWPCFEFQEQDEMGIRVILEPHKGPSSSSIYLSNQEIAVIHENTLERLDREHERLRVNLELRERYPNLVFYIDHKTLKPTSLWVRREDRDAEAMVSKTEGFTDEELQHWNELAGQAITEGWFWCSGHNRPEPRSEYSYFFFAGSYCKAWKEENPGHFRSASQETYN